MKTLKKYYTVIKYSISPEAFTKKLELFRTSGTSSQWQLLDEDIYKLTYLFDFIAIDERSNESLINYYGRLELLCQFDDLAKDAVEIIDLKAQARLSMSEFLEQNTKSLFKYIDFSSVIFGTAENAIDALYTPKSILIKEEIKDIKRVMNILTQEEMSEEERNLQNRK